MLKSLERAWKRLWVRLLTGLMRSPGARPDWDARPYKLLFLRHDRLGDMIVSTPVMRVIAESHPGFELDVLASPANAAAIEGAPYVRRVIVFDKRDIGSYLRTVATLRAERYDVVIDCMVTAPSVTTLLLMLASNAPYRVGIAGRGNDAAINVAVPPAGGIQYMPIELGALSAAFGVDPSTVDWRPELHVSPAQLETAAARWRAAGRGTGQRVLVNVSAGTAIRQWQTDRYAAVIAHLRRRLPEAAVLITGAPSDASRVEEVARLSGATPAATPRLADVFALVATADFVFTPDTSIAHAASAFGPRTVVMHRRTEPARWGLYPGIGEDIEHDDVTLLTLEVPPVLAAIDRVLARRG
ncbi:MAG TPA: glycosyltransferase family 9 protein [Gemmatimonadaceae bacterium]|nr:glycosyltransferase family 9 protein [Gemmatimonadaceae bacterium]